MAIANAQRSAGELEAAELTETDSEPTKNHTASTGSENLFDLHGEPIAGSLRFPLGAAVECRLGEENWMPGTIIGHFYREKKWPENRRAPYQIEIDNDGPTIFAPVDNDTCVRSALRFPLDAVVECYMGKEKGWALGVVTRHYHRDPSWETSRWVPYQIRLEEGAAGTDATFVWAPVDDDTCVRAIAQWPWPGAKVKGARP